MMMTAADTEGFFAALKVANPHPASELEYSSVFELLVAVLLSAQATDISVNKATRLLFPVAHTPKQILDLGYDCLCDYIRTIGLYRNKAKHLLETCDRLIKDFNSEVPRSREALESLPGVGRKTANVILNVAFGEPTCAVDTHIFRVANRTGLAPGKTPLAVEQGLMGQIPSAYSVEAHHWLILLGRYICQARKPRCHECCVARWCEFKSNPSNLATPAH